MKDNLLSPAQAKLLFDGVDHIVCAVSGGADSVALLHRLRSLQQELGFTLSAAHFNHCLRGKESDEDEDFVRELCKQWNIPLSTGCKDVAAYAKIHKLSTEDAARKLRYEFLLAQPGHIALAHHANDQVETVLLNLLRGTGLKGLCAMAPRDGRLLRPLLTVTAAEIRAYLQHHNLSHREDSTNAEDDALRNRLRHHIVPLLAAENPSLAAAVGRMTAQLQLDEAYLDEAAQALYDKAAGKDGLRCEVLREAPAVLRKRVIRKFLNPLSNPSAAHVNAVERLLERNNGSAAVHLPDGMTARREYGSLHLISREDRDPIPALSLEPGSTVFVPGYEVTVSPPHIPQVLPDQKNVFALKPDLGLTLRSRQTGDVLRLAAGSKSLKKLMIDRKVPAAERTRIPVIACEKGVAAVYGLGADRDLTAAPGEPAIIVTILQEEKEL